MKILSLMCTLICALALASLSACGGGGGGLSTSPPPPPPPPTGGISRLSVAIGPVSNFSSIVVNGVTYDTSTAVFTIDDSPGTQADLRVGDVVFVDGSIDENGTTGTADIVIFDDSVKGPVESIDLVNSQLVVLGQTVLVRPETSFDDGFSPPSLEGVSVAQIVEVSGLIDANGNISATRIEPKPANTPFEVHGTVSNLDAAAMTFNINNLVVDFSSATLDNFPGGQIMDGDFVEAKGAAPLGTAGELLATEVELETLTPGIDVDDRVEIEGFITRFISATDFDVSGLPVTTNASTVFEGGVAADLGLNIKVEAEGDINSGGVLVATKIDIRPSKAVRVTADADSVDAPNNSLVILGINVTVNELTRFEDKSSADVDPLTLGDIVAGNYLEIRGDEFPAGSGTILATIVEREDADTEVILQGFVETVSDPTFTILGVTVDTSSAVLFLDENDQPISSADFFTRLAANPNSLVKAEGTETTDTTITATELEFEVEF